MRMKQLLLLPLLLLLAWQAPAAVEELNGIAAVVNDDVITRSELQQRVKTIVGQLRAQHTQLPPQAILERQILERMIVEKLQLEQAEQLGIRIDDEALNQIIANIAKENGLTLIQFRDTLEREGISFAYFRQQIRDEVTITRLRNSRINNRITVSPQEVDTFLDGQHRQQAGNEEYHLLHILIALPSDATPEQIETAHATAEKVQGELQAGADFRRTAITYSNGQQALEGGDIGWRRAGQLPTIFSDVVAKMAIGELSPIIRSPSGFHLLKLEEKRGETRNIVRQAHARHILIRSSDLVSDSEAQQRLARLRERILGGEDFAALARANSEDPGSAVKGGDLGWADPSIFVDTFRETIEKTRPGTLSEPFKSQFGWHILEVLDWRDYDSTEEVQRNKAFEALRQRKIEEETENWLRRLRDEAYVEIRLDQ